jgi:hypothetical protein
MNYVTALTTALDSDEQTVVATSFSTFVPSDISPDTFCILESDWNALESSGSNI